MPKLRKYQRILKNIYDVLPMFKKMSDSDLKDQVKLFKQSIREGTSIEKILPEVFATAIEADKRVLGLEPYKVQVLGGIAMFFGNIAEIKTGEGKTLVATMPLFARALMGNKGNFLITANDYLAERDGAEMGKVYKWLGLTVGIGVGEMEDDEKATLYENDIIYTTHSKLGFDFLFDNLGTELSQQYVKRFNFAIIDEIDAVLLDGAQTSLVISGAPKVQSSLFEMSNWFSKCLAEEDFEFSDDERKVWFTKTGLNKIKQYFNIDEIFSEKNFGIYRHIVLALQANYLKKRGRDYVVDSGKILLLDEVNGRKMEGVKLSGGIHQAIEAKESIEITTESKTLGTISYQSLFKKFKRLSGMTGTAKTDENEFIETFHLQVFQIPTHRPIRRADHPDQVLIGNQAKIEKSIEMVQTAISERRPVLIETGSVSMSNLYSLILLQNRIPHNLLNATTVAREKEIISEAGGTMSVTLATSMAGRGTDIKLSDKAKEHGGLVVIGTERMSNKRIDNQLRGRSGRQGEPGDSSFLVSLEDKVIIENSSKDIRRYRKKLNRQIDAGDLEYNTILKDRKSKKAMNVAQEKLSNAEVQGRKRMIAFDAILSNQREKVYNLRNKILLQDSDYQNFLLDTAIKKTVVNFVNDTKKLDFHSISDFVFNNFDSSLNYNQLKNKFDPSIDRNEIKSVLTEMGRKLLQRSFDRFSNQNQLNYFKKIVLLKSIDSEWIDQLDYLQQLKFIVDGRSSAQHKPINEFGRESRIQFLKMEERIWGNILKNAILTELDTKEDGSIDLKFP
jgi:preprotein translocase subunit SecA